jgi:hypothetical protein
VLTDDYFSVPDEEIKGIESVLTVVGGKVVHATDEFASHAPPAIPVLPEWSPVKVFGGYGAPLDIRKAARAGVPMEQHQHDAHCHGTAAITPRISSCRRRSSAPSLRGLLRIGLRLLRVLNELKKVEMEIKLRPTRNNCP